MPAWPASLPQLVAVAGYQESPPELALRSQMDAGPAKLRRRFTAGVRPLAVRLDLDAAQVETLDTFYVTTLAGGALRFDWVDPRNQGAAELRFVRPPVFRPTESDVAWTALIELEIMP
jgi:hypothetical protein